MQTKFWYQYFRPGVARLFCSRANLNFMYYRRPQFFKLLMLFMKFLGSRNFFGPFFPFLFIFDDYWEKNWTFLNIFNINLIFAMFLSNDKKVQGPQKQVRGPHAARGPHFGHACFRLWRPQSLTQTVWYPLYFFIYLCGFDVECKIEHQK